MKVIKEKSQSIEKLCINSFSGRLMLSMLRFSAPTLTHLIISTSFPDEEYEGVADLPTLEYLKINSVDSILRVLICKNLKSLNIDSCRDRNAFYVFLEQSNYLPHLLSLTTFKLFWKICTLIDISFKLETLVMTMFSSINSKNVYDFLLTQSKSLKYLTILEKQILVPTIDFVIDNMTNLESLRIHGSILNAWKSDNETDSKSWTIKNLEMNLITDLFAFPGAPELNESKDIVQILSKCKNLEKLNFQGNVSDVKIFETNLSLPSLKTLKIETIRQFSFWNCLEFNNLENLTLMTLNSCPGNIRDLLNFLPKLPKLKNLQINTWPYNRHQMNNLKISEIKRLFEFLKNYESFKINRSESIPIKFFSYFNGFDSEKFKLLEISCDDDENILENFQNNFKNTRFQTIFNKSQKMRSSNAWEENVENLGNHDEDENDNRVRKMYHNFMSNSLYPK